MKHLYSTLPLCLQSDTEQYRLAVVRNLATTQCRQAVACQVVWDDGYAREVKGQGMHSGAEARRLMANQPARWVSAEELQADAWVPAAGQGRDLAWEGDDGWLEMRTGSSR